MADGKMCRNVGHVDKWIRVAGGVVILAIGLYYKNWLGLLGLLPIVVAFVGWCPVYTLLGVNTCPADKKIKARRFPEEMRNIK